VSCSAARLVVPLRKPPYLQCLTAHRIVPQVSEFALMTALLSHWIACIWGLLPQLEGHGQPNWMDKFTENSKYGEMGPVSACPQLQASGPACQLLRWLPTASHLKAACLRQAASLPACPHPPACPQASHS
jgi:hypothetical protein